jgi:hypothetical protein
VLKSRKSQLFEYGTTKADGIGMRDLIKKKKGLNNLEIRLADKTRENPTVSDHIEGLKFCIPIGFSDPTINIKKRGQIGSTIF